jgi:hypothetical protein
MKVDAGLWINHERTLIVITFPDGEKTLELSSHLGPLPEVDKGPGAVFDRAATMLLNRFYTEIIGAIRDAEAILIFGPGEAKHELRQHLERARLGAKVVGVEAAGPMTDAQIADKVREQFQSVKIPGRPTSSREDSTPTRPKAGIPLPTHARQEQRS